MNMIQQHNAVFTCQPKAGLVENMVRCMAEDLIMACYPIQKDGQNIGFICGDLGEPCRECGTVSDNLCDYPVGDGKTCDRAICNEHSKQVGVDIHYCPTHAKHWEKFKRSGGVKKELENVVPFST